MSGRFAATLSSSVSAVSVKPPRRRRTEVEDVVVGDGQAGEAQRSAQNEGDDQHEREPGGRGPESAGGWGHRVAALPAGLENAHDSRGYPAAHSVKQRSEPGSGGSRAWLRTWSSHSRSFWNCREAPPCAVLGVDRPVAAGLRRRCGLMLAAAADRSRSLR